MAKINQRQPRIEGGVAPPGTLAAIYSRISPRPSRPGRGYSVLSIEEQQAVCREACERFGWKIKYVLVDRLESAKDMDRPNLQRLMNYAEEGRFGVAVVWKLDRMWRSLRDAVNLNDFFAQAGIAFHSCTENFDNQTPFGRFVFRNVASAAELEREIIRERTAMAAHARARMGLWVSSVTPFGYARDSIGGLAIDEGEAHAVRLIFGHYMRLKSMEAVAEAMNEQGVTARKGQPWTYARIQRILSSDMYAGSLTLAGVNHNRPDLKIVEPFALSEVSTLRAGGKKRRGRKAPPSRRETAIKNVFREYNRVLGEQEASGEMRAVDPLGEELQRIREGLE